MTENNTGTVRVTESTGSLYARGLSPADIQRISRRRMYLAQKQYSHGLDNGDTRGSNAFDMGNMQSSPPSYDQKKSQAVPSSLLPARQGSTIYQSTSDNYTSSSMQQRITDSSNLAMAPSPVNAKNNDQKAYIRQQLLLEVLAQIDISKNKADVSKRELNSDTGVAFDWGEMPRIGSVHSVQGIVELSPALVNRSNSASKSLQCVLTNRSSQEQSLPKEEMTKTSKLNVKEIARLILSGAFDGFLTNTESNRSDQLTNHPSNVNQTQQLSRASNASFAQTVQVDKAGVGTNTSLQAVRNNFSTTRASIQEPMNDRLLAMAANEIIGSFNRQSRSGNTAPGQTTYTDPSQRAAYNQRTYVNANNNAYQRSVTSGQLTSLGNVQNGSQVRNGQYVNTVTQSPVRPVYQTHRTNVNPVGGLGSRPPVTSFSRSQLLNQDQRGTAYLQHINTFNRNQVNQSHVGSNQATNSAHQYQRSVAVANRSRVGNNHVVMNPVNQDPARSTTSNNARLQRLRGANLERYHRVLSRGQSYPPTTNQTRTARVFPIVSRLMSSQNTAILPEPVKSTDHKQIESPHDPLSCVDCLLLGSCPINKSLEATKSKEKESLENDEDDIVITKVTTKDAERGPIERIDVDDWAENALSSPERAAIKQEPVDETSCLMTEKPDEVNVDQTLRHDRFTQQQTDHDIELSQIDEIPAFSPVSSPSQTLADNVSTEQIERSSSETSENRKESDEKVDDKSDVTQIEDISVATVTKGQEKPICFEKYQTEEQSFKKQEKTSLQNNGNESSTSNGKDHNDEPENSQVRHEYNDMFYDVISSKDKELLAELEEKLEDNSRKLQTQTISWIKKNILKARLKMLTKIERIRNKYELVVKHRVDKSNTIALCETNAEVEKELASNAQDYGEEQMLSENNSTEKEAYQGKQETKMDKVGDSKSQDVRDQTAENSSAIEMLFEMDAGNTCGTNPGSSSGATVDPSNSLDTTVNPSNSSDMTVDPSNSSDMTVNPSNSSDMTVTPGNSSGATVDPSNSLDMTVDPSNSTDTTVDASNSSGTTVDPSKTSGTTVEPSNSSGTTVEPSNSSGTTVEPSNSSDMTNDPSNTSGTTVERSNSSGTTVEPSNISVEVQVVEERNQVDGSSDTDVNDVPMTLEDMIKSLDDIPLPGEEECERKKRLGYDHYDVIEHGSDINKNLNKSILSEASFNKLDSNKDDMVESTFDNNMSNIQNISTDNNKRSSKATEEMPSSLDNVNNITCRSDSKAENTGSAFEDCIVRYSSSSILGVTSVYERRVSTDNTVLLNTVSNDESTKVKHVHNCEQKTAKRKSLDDEKSELKKIKKEMTDSSSSYNIWERLSTKYS